MAQLGIEVNLVMPDGASVHEIQNMSRAWFNLVPFREVGRHGGIPQGRIRHALCGYHPHGHCGNGPLHSRHPEVLNQQGAAVDYEAFIDEQTRFVSQAAWFSRSIDCQNLTGKKAVVFGDSTHAAAITKILAREMGIHVVLAGTYCKYDEDWFREQVGEYCDEILISEDNGEIADRIAKLEPAAIFGTQMERHVGKRLDIPCGVIAAPIHIQNFPVGYRPFMGYEGANQIVDLVYNSFTLGMEDHLLEFFGGHDTKEVIDQNHVCRVRPGLEQGWPGRTAESSRLRAGQGEAQHREVCSGAGHRADYR
jgi:light-independent protochlorophyllide reductase subunit B